MAETILMYGESDGGKTAQLRHIAEWHFARTGEITRAIIADTTIEPLRPVLLTPDHPEGIVQALMIRGMADPWNRLDKFAHGWWPQLAQQPDGSFKLIFEAPKVEGGRILAGDRKVGQVFIEGLSTIAELLLQDHADHAAARPMWGTGKEGVVEFESLAEVRDSVGKVTQDKLKIGRAVGGHYGSVQRWMLNHLIPRFSELRTVERVVWTAHTARGKDEWTGIEKSAGGPATVGQATVDITTRLFSHAFHLETDTKFDAHGNVQRDYRAWFVTHPDEVLKTIKWPAKVSVTDDLHKGLLKRFPKGHIPLNDLGMEQFLDAIYPPAAPGDGAKP